ncbi:hypothetical protein [Actinomadura gamaensis]|uniref:Uncharacterized protein n=1 Tax=Actinomadura gamaensis TaxID=1763541 RepID=A0ABV9TZF9_9ACTN
MVQLTRAERPAPTPVAAFRPLLLDVAVPLAAIALAAVNAGGSAAEPMQKMLVEH